MARAIWKPKLATFSGGVGANLTGRPHAHQCSACYQRYEDACDAPATDQVCSSCQMGRPRALWNENKLPVTCCPATSRKASKAERQLYKLAGQATWWICGTCSRTIPYQPSVPIEEK